MCDRERDCRNYSSKFDVNMYVHQDISVFECIFILHNSFWIKFIIIYRGTNWLLKVLGR